MPKEVLYLILWIIFWVFIWIIIWKIIKYTTLRDERQKSVKKSKSVIMWEVYEKILPFLPDFPYKPRDMVFVWKGIDYIIFDWLNEWELKEIIFLELKSWTSNLNKNERMIRDLISKKHIKYLEYKIK